MNAPQLNPLATSMQLTHRPAPSNALCSNAAGVETDTDILPDGTWESGDLGDEHALRVDRGIERGDDGPRRVLDVAVAAGLLVVSAPVLGATLLLVRIVDGAPVLYRGVRLGLHAQPFTITKIRTLQPHAQSAVGGDLLNDQHVALRTRCGNFLRETRLDELPQLVHVIKGDMALFGPRPERPEVYESKCRHIRGYADRFGVRPGLFGYAQILTPHGTPKRIRAIIDRRFARAPRSNAFDVALLGLTLSALLRETGGRIGRFVGSTWQKYVVRRYDEKRMTRRRQLPPGRATAHRMGNRAGNRTGDDGTLLHVGDANDKAFRATGAGCESIESGDRLILRVLDPTDGSIHRARVRVTDRMFRADGQTSELIAHYEPTSDNSSYVLEQYLLERSIVRLPASLRGRRTATAVADSR